MTRAADAATTDGMRWTALLACSLLSSLLALGCGDDDGGSPDASTDAAAPDGSAGDGGGSEDAGGAEDGGARDDAAMTPDAGPVDPCAAAELPALALEDIVEGHRFAAPVFVTSAPGDADTLYVVEKAGRIRVVQEGAVLDTPFFDIRGTINTDGEQGLLGLAFHPEYASNGRFFVYFTPGSPRRNVVAEYRRSAADPLVADAEEVARLVEEEDSQPNHNGGMIAFGPDGFLYVAMGDEGGGGDRHGEIGNGLDTTTLFGSILRLDVDAAGDDYAAAGNPFTLPDGQPQIWAYGVRNPWRFSFDRLTDDLWVADVGQNRLEEVTVLPAGTAPGANLGWRAYEADEVFDADLTDLVPDHAAPQIVVPHDSAEVPVASACSITGGNVYRGSAVPGLWGWYLYGDYCSPNVAAVRWCEGAVQDHVRVGDLSFQGSGLVSFGEDGHGELYVAYIGDGRVARVVAGE